jgi:hypothetical protein
MGCLCYLPRLNRPLQGDQVLLASNNLLPVDGGDVATRQQSHSVRMSPFYQDEAASATEAWCERQGLVLFDFVADPSKVRQNSVKGLRVFTRISQGRD